MSNKKIIIFAVIASLALAGGGWYYAKRIVPTASISGPVTSQTPNSQNIEPGIVYGNPNAPVTIEEYTNFLCGACAQAAIYTLPQIENDYVRDGKVKMIFYIYPPLELGKAALCAQEQNKFIAYHDYLFSHQKQIAEEKDIKDFAVNAGLDEQKFNECYVSDKYNKKIEKWLNEGQERGVDATPTFFINGQKIIGAQSYEEFKKIIDEKLSQIK